MIGLSQDMQEVVSIAPTGSSPSRDGLLQAKFVLLHRGGNGTLQWGHWILFAIQVCLPSVELLVRHWLLALLHETKDFLPSQWFWRGERFGIGSEATYLSGSEVQDCDRFPGAVLLRVGGGGFWASEAPKKGRKRAAFARARIIRRL